jgi:uncharacterized membrane protein
LGCLPLHPFKPDFFHPGCLCRSHHHDEPEQAQEDYRTNYEAKLEIEALQIQLNKIETEKVDKIIIMLEEMKKSH